MNSLIQAIAAVACCSDPPPQRSLAAGDYESRYCGDAIACTQQGADLNRVSDKTRDYLHDPHDLRRLQDRLEER
jgi:hypothetical protein